MQKSLQQQQTEFHQRLKQLMYRLAKVRNVVLYSHRLIQSLEKQLPLQALQRIRIIQLSISSGILVMAKRLKGLLLHMNSKLPAPIQSFLPL